MYSDRNYVGQDWIVRVDGRCEEPHYRDQNSYLGRDDLVDIIGTNDIEIEDFDFYTVVYSPNPPVDKRIVNTTVSLITGMFLLGDVLIVNPNSLKLWNTM